MEIAFRKQTIALKSAANLLFNLEKHMKLISLHLAALLFCITGTHVFAGSCDLSYTRTACAGKEVISFKKCDGKASCVKNVVTDSADACRVKAVAACANG